MLVICMAFCYLKKELSQKEKDIWCISQNNVINSCNSCLQCYAILIFLNNAKIISVLYQAHPRNFVISDYIQILRCLEIFPKRSPQLIWVAYTFDLISEIVVKRTHTIECTAHFLAKTIPNFFFVNKSNRVAKPSIESLLWWL